MPPPGKRAFQVKPAVMPVVKKVEVRKKASPSQPFALQITQGATVFREFPLKPLIIITDTFQANGNIRVVSDGSVSKAKGFRFKINRISRQLTGKLEIFMADETEKWVTTKVSMTDNGRVSVFTDLLRKWMKEPRSVATRLKLSFSEDTLEAEILASPVEKGRVDNKRTVGVRMDLDPCGVTPFKQ